MASFCSETLVSAPEAPGSRFPWMDRTLDFLGGATMGGSLGPRGPPRWARDPRAVRGPFWPVFGSFSPFLGSFSPCPSPTHHAELQFLRRVHLDARMKAGFPRDLGCSFSHDLMRHIGHAWCLPRHPPANPSSHPPTHPSVLRSDHAHFAGVRRCMLSPCGVWCGAT